MRLIKWLFLPFIWLILFLSFAVTWSLLNLPETESIQISRQPSITFLDKEGRIIASYGDIYGQSIQFNDLPKNLINAVIVTEDKRFFFHPGIDIKGIVRAAIVNLKAGRIVQGWDFVDDDAIADDGHGHGTHVAGTIAGANDGIGITGVAYNSRIMPIRVLNDSGSGTYAAVNAGIRYAADNGADVINISLGGGAFNQNTFDAIKYASELFR